MPAEVSRQGQLVLDRTSQSLTELAAQCPHLTGAALMAEDRSSVRKAAESDDTGSWSYDETVRRKADVQGRALASAMHNFLRGQDVDSNLIARAIRGSSVIGRQFGRLPDREDVSVASEIVSLVRCNPHQSFVYNRGVLDFSDDVKAKLAPHYAADVGCAALTEVFIDGQGKNQTMFNAYWDGVMDDFVTRHVEGNEWYIDATMTLN